RRRPQGRAGPHPGGLDQGDGDGRRLRPDCLRTALQLRSTEVERTGPTAGGAVPRRGLERVRRRSLPGAGAVLRRLLHGVTGSGLEAPTHVIPWRGIDHGTRPRPSGTPLSPDPIIRTSERVVR